MAARLALVKTDGLCGPIFCRLGQAICHALMLSGDQLGLGDFAGRDILRKC